jgi:hypothetical protein
MSADVTEDEGDAGQGVVDAEGGVDLGAEGEAVSGDVTEEPTEEPEGVDGDAASAEAEVSHLLQLDLLLFTAAVYSGYVM